MNKEIYGKKFYYISKIITSLGKPLTFNVISIKYPLRLLNLMTLRMFQKEVASKIVTQDCYVVISVLEFVIIMLLLKSIGQDMIKRGVLRSVKERMNVVILANICAINARMELKIVYLKLKNK